MIRNLLLTLAIASIPAVASAGTSADPCDTLLSTVNRPTVTQSTCAVKSDKVVVETGYANITTEKGYGNVVLYPLASVRVGTEVKNLELDVQVPSSARYGAQRGASDAGFGAKYQMSNIGPIQVAASAGISLPTGTNGFSNNGTGVNGGLDFAYPINSTFGLGASAKFNSNSNGVVKYGSFTPSLELTAAVNKNTQLFVEGAQVSNAFGPNTQVLRLVDVGAKYALGKKTVLDASYGRSSGQTVPFRYTELGITYSP